MKERAGCCLCFLSLPQLGKTDAYFVLTLALCVEAGVVAKTHNLTPHTYMIGINHTKNNNKNNK